MYPHNTVKSVKAGLLLAAFGYLVFAVYGSLVPLEYRHIPFDLALERFRNIPYLQLGIGSRADWVANILLFVPLTFLWLGRLWPRRPTRRLPMSLAVWVVAILLSLGVEFTQLYFPQRTVSANDLLAESLGALIGIMLWWWRGPQLIDWIGRWRDTRGVTGTSEYLLWFYLAGLFLYSLLPLDLTISPVEIYHKWRQGGLNLIPFAYPVEDTAQFVYDLLTDVAVWVPVSLLWVLSGKKGRLQAWRWAVVAALLLEAGQFFVFSRVSDVTDLLTAMLGSGVGVWVSGWIVAGDVVRVGDGRSGFGGTGWLLAGSVLWIVVLLAVFWYPFDFHLDGGFLRERLPLLYQVPFQNYYYGTEFRAVTSLLQKLLFFVPLGVLLAAGVIRVPRGAGRTLFGIFSIALIAGVPFAIELGQVALAGKYPDTTDWFLEMAGGASGYFVFMLGYRRITGPTGLRERAPIR